MGLPDKRKRRFFIAWPQEKEELVWYPIAAGLYAWKERSETDYLLFYPLNPKKEKSREEKENVKELAFQFHYCEGDMAQEMLRNAHGKQVLFRQEMESENGETIEKTSRAYVRNGEEEWVSSDHVLKWEVLLEIR